MDELILKLSVCWIVSFVAIVFICCDYTRNY